jgi:hypothetical protein
LIGINNEIKVHLVGLSHVYVLDLFVQTACSDGLCNAITYVFVKITYLTLRRYEGMSNNKRFYTFQFMSFDNQGSNKVYAHILIVNEQGP